MEVVATDRGYFGSLREVGDKFEVPSGTSGSWFKPVKVDSVKIEPEVEFVKRGRPSKADGE